MRFGGELGLNMANVSESPAPSPSPTMAIGARVGVIAEFGITDAIFIQPGVMFSMMGFKVDPITAHLNYIHIPINIVYKLDAGPGKIFFGLTPFLSYGVSASLSGLPSGASGTIEFGSNAGQVKPLDFGAGINVGYELEMGLFFRAGYDYSLANSSNVSGVTDHNTCIHIGAGYFFGGK